MRGFPYLALMLLVGLWASCGSGGSGDIDASGNGNTGDARQATSDGAPDNGEGSDAGSARPDAGSGVGRPDAGPDAGSGSGPELPPDCVKACQTPENCALANLQRFDADNYECLDNRCVFTGCNNDGECTADLGAGYVCRPGPLGFSVCTQSCQSPSDCVIPGSQRFDEDNYTCESGRCVHQGCNSDAECIADLGASYICRPGSIGIDICIESCQAPADCAIPGSQRFGADNYSCTGNACVYNGCLSDAECRADIDNTYVCNR